MPVRPPAPDEHSAIRALLIDSGLPVEDLDRSTIAFLVGVDGECVVGVIGLEAFGEVAPLRSLAVAPDHRRAGIGARLVEAMEAQARARDVHTVVLLTQTAEAFFARRGYRVIERSHAPQSVQASAEFRSLCPSSATCMTRHLDAGAVAAREQASAVDAAPLSRRPAP